MNKRIKKNLIDFLQKLCFVLLINITKKLLV